MDPSLADQDMWEAYQESMEKVLAAFPDKPNKKVTAEQFQEVKQYLLSKNPFNESPLIVSDQDEHGNKQNFKEILKNRKENLLNATGFNSHQYDLAMRCITNLGSKCAKKQDILPLLIAWEKIKDGGMALKPNFISTFTYVFSLEEKYLGLSSEVATFHGLLFGVTENAVYLRIKALVSMGDPVQAETLLDKLKDDTKEGKRLRTFAPILEHYCNEGDAYSILRLWKRIREAPGAHLDAETYAMIIGSIARRGFFRHDAKPIAGLSELGLKPCGPALLDEIFNVMVEDLIEITEEAALDLYRDFMEGFSENKHQQQGIAEIPRCNGSDPQIFVGRVTIDQSTAMCPVSGANLRLFTLDSDQRKHVHDTLLKMASTQHEEFHATRAKIKKKNVKANSDFAEAELRKFSDWLV